MSPAGHHGLILYYCVMGVATLVQGLDPPQNMNLLHGSTAHQGHIIATSRMCTNTHNMLIMMCYIVLSLLN